MHPVAERAKARIVVLERQIEHLRTLMALPDDILDMLVPAGEEVEPREHGSVTGAEPTRVRVRQRSFDPDAPRIQGALADFAEHKRPRKNPPPEKVVDTALAIIRARGRPLTRRQLSEALAAQDIVIESVNPLKALGTTLWRASDRIVSLPEYGYWPKADDYEPAGYRGVSAMPDKGLPNVL